MILIREVAEAPDYYTFQKTSVHTFFWKVWVSYSLLVLKFPPRGGEIVNQLFVGIDVGSRGNTAYLMRPDGEKHSNFTVQNNRGGAEFVYELLNTS